MHIDICAVYVYIKYVRRLICSVAMLHGHVITIINFTIVPTFLSAFVLIHIYFNQANNFYKLYANNACILYVL